MSADRSQLTSEWVLTRARLGPTAPRIVSVPSPSQNITKTSRGYPNRCFWFSWSVIVVLSPHELTNSRLKWAGLKMLVPRTKFLWAATTQRRRSHVAHLSFHLLLPYSLSVATAHPNITCVPALAARVGLSTSRRLVSAPLVHTHVTPLEKEQIIQWAAEP